MIRLQELHIPRLSLQTTELKSLGECADLGDAKSTDIVKEGIGILKTDGSIIDYAEIVNRPFDIPKDEIAGIAFEKEGLRLAIYHTPTRCIFNDGKTRCKDYISLEENWFTDLDGKGNTEKLMKTHLGKDWAVNVCYDTIINGKHCYLPALGQALIIDKYIGKIDELLQKGGYEPLAVSKRDYYSSTIGLKDKDRTLNTERSATEDWLVNRIRHWRFKGSFIFESVSETKLYVLPITDLD